MWVSRGSPPSYWRGAPPPTPHHPPPGPPGGPLFFFSPPMLVLALLGLPWAPLAGDAITIHRQRIVGLAWSLMLFFPPIMMVLAIVGLPWAAAIELQVAQPANALGQFFSETFERRTSRTLEIVGGDARLAALVAL